MMLEDSVIMTQRNTDFYGIKSIQHQAATTWNKLQNETSHKVLQDLRSKTKEFITNKILNSYEFFVCFKPKTKIILTFLTKIVIKEVLLL